jgi:hypothetical protein
MLRRRSPNSNVVYREESRRLSTPDKHWLQLSQPGHNYKDQHLRWLTDVISFDSGCRLGSCTLEVGYMLIPFQMCPQVRRKATQPASALLVSMPAQLEQYGADKYAADASVQAIRGA